MHLFNLLILTLATDEFFLGNVGKEDCPGGNIITDTSTCQKACNQLNATIKELKDGNICYTDKKGYCYQNGWNGGGAAFVCKKGKNIYKIWILL